MGVGSGGRERGPRGRRYISIYRYREIYISDSFSAETNTIL